MGLPASGRHYRLLWVSWLPASGRHYQLLGVSWLPASGRHYRVICLRLGLCVMALFETVMLIGGDTLAY